MKAIDQKDIVGELIDLELNRSAISTLTITHDMVLGKTGVGRGYFMFAMADTLALALVDTEFALTAVSNVKYKVPVYPGDRLVAKADVTNIKDDRYYIRVIIKKEKIQKCSGRSLLLLRFGMLQILIKITELAECLAASNCADELTGGFPGLVCCQERMLKTA